MLACFPMAGSGSRFLKAGYQLPKPLLPLGEQRLIQWALLSTEHLATTPHYFLRPELSQHPLIQGLLPPGCWHAILTPTPGPLQTLLASPTCLNTAEEVLICDCDSTMDSQELSEAIELFRDSHAAGGVTIRRTEDPMCSYAQVDSEWWVSQTREHDPFSPWSTTGPYWFVSGQAFLQAARKAAAAHHVSISPVYNYLEGKTKAVPVDSFKHFGTPAEYEAARQLLCQS